MKTLNLSNITAKIPFARWVYNEIQLFLNRMKFNREFNDYKKLSLKFDNRFELKWSDRWACLNDKTSQTLFDAHYVYHTAWAARKVADLKPGFHVDLSSSLYFSAITSAFVPVKFFDFRPAKLNLNNFDSDFADIKKLSFEDKSLYSLSCMHVVEHIGLGRYGDEFDPEGDLKAIKELKRVLADEGHLFFVVPIGKPKIQFNAHRIYAYNQIIDYFSDLHLHEFSLISDNGEFFTDASPELADKQKYGCGCFWYIKKPVTE